MAVRLAAMGVAICMQVEAVILAEPESLPPDLGSQGSFVNNAAIAPRVGAPWITSMTRISATELQPHRTKGWCLTGADENEERIKQVVPEDCAAVIREWVQKRG